MRLRGGRGARAASVVGLALACCVLAGCDEGASGPVAPVASSAGPMRAAASAVGPGLAATRAGGDALRKPDAGVDPDEDAVEAPKPAPMPSAARKGRAL